MDSSTTTTSNPRGIPVFPFMPNVNDYVKSLEEVESTLQRFQEMISKYTFMQQNVERRAVGLREKLPEMKRTLDTVKFLKQKREIFVKKLRDNDSENDNQEDLEDETEQKETDVMETTFSLQDTLYAKAKIRSEKVDEVYLWLGANVMVAYPLDEAASLLKGKHDKAKESLKAAEEDLEFLRVQITTLEVAVARVHNWDVAEKRKLRAEGKLKDEGGDGIEEEERK